MTLQQAKDGVAKNHSFKDWNHLLRAHSGKLDTYINMVIELCINTPNRPDNSTVSHFDKLFQQFPIEDIKDWIRLKEQEKLKATTRI